MLYLLQIFLVFLNFPKLFLHIIRHYYLIIKNLKFYFLQLFSSLKNLSYSLIKLSSTTEVSPHNFKYSFKTSFVKLFSFLEIDLTFHSILLFKALCVIFEDPIIILYSASFSKIYAFV